MLLNLRGALALLIVATTKFARAEPVCAGSTYNEPTCGASCSQTFCQDISFDHTASLFQCCVSEMPKGGLYTVIAILLALGAFFLYRKNVFKFS